MLYFADPAGKIVFEKFAKKFMGLPPDESAVTAALRPLQSFFDVAERLLSHANYMAGDEFSLVDIFYIPLIQRLLACGCGEMITSHQAVDAWWNRCINRPGIKSMLTADKAAMSRITVSGP